MSFRKFLWILIFSLALGLAACSANQDSGLPDTGNGEVPPQAALEAQKALAGQLNVAVEDIQIVSTEQVQWPDACLGFSVPGEMCAQVITPGWKVIFNVNGQQYEVHTDKPGDTIRFPDQLTK